MAKSNRVAARRARVEILRNQGKTNGEIAAELNVLKRDVERDVAYITPRDYDERVLDFYRLNPDAKIATVARRLGLRSFQVDMSLWRLKQRGLWSSCFDRMDEAVEYFKTHRTAKRSEVARLFSVNAQALGQRLNKIGIRRDLSNRRGGKTLRELAQDWGTTETAARAYCKYRGLKFYHEVGWKRVVEYYKENPEMSRHELAVALGESPSTIRRACRLGGIDPPRKPIKRNDYSTVAPDLVDRVMSHDAQLPPKWLRDELLFCVEPIRLPPSYMRRYVEIYKSVKNDKSEFGRGRLGFKGGQNG